MKDKKNVVGFTVRVEYDVKDERLVQVISQVLGKGKREKTVSVSTLKGRREKRIHVWTRKIKDLSRFARTIANLQADHNIKLNWRCEK